MAEGDIGTVIDTLNFEANLCDYPDIIHVSGDVYAIAYTGVDLDLFVCTFSVDAAGDIGAAVIDVVELDTANGVHPSIVHVSGIYYAISYRTSDADGRVITIHITDAGDISGGIYDSLLFDTGACSEPVMIHIAGTTYAVIYRGQSDDGFLRTFAIDSSGDIGAAYIDHYEFDTVYGADPSIINISGNIYAVAYTINGYFGKIFTLAIDPDGNIPGAVIDNVVFDGAQAWLPEIFHVTGDIYAVSYCGPGSDGFLKTFEITGAGSIGAGPIDTFEYDTTYGNASDVKHVSGNVFAIAYTGTDNDGYIITVSIDAAGNIGASVIDSYEFDGAHGDRPNLLYISGSIYIIAYESAAGVGKVISLDVSTVLPSAAKHLLLMGVG